MKKLITFALLLTIIATSCTPKCYKRDTSWETARRKNLR
jgi:hypothetical protein